MKIQLKSTCHALLLQGLLLGIPFFTSPMESYADEATNTNVVPVLVSEAAPLAAHSVAEKSSKSNYRGWDYIVEKLRVGGVSEEALAAVFSDKRMPRFSPVPFKLKPRETWDIYSGFTSERQITTAFKFLDGNRESFDRAEHELKVTKYVVAAILLIETHCGQNTGRELVVNRLARVSSVGEPKNLQFNLKQQRLYDRSIGFSDVAERAKYLEETFFPELLALFEMQSRYGFDILELRGSSAGAFGLPQFLPRSFLAYALDGDRDGIVSLFSVPDAIWSAANYLHSHGWVDNAPVQERRKVLWTYNRSHAYGEAVLKVAILLKQRDVVPLHQK